MFSNELHRLDQFEKHFADYRALIHNPHLSVENTNLKAQRLSIGPAQELVESFRGALEQVASGAPATTPGTSGPWRRPHSLPCARSRPWRPHASSSGRWRNDPPREENVERRGYSQTPLTALAAVAPPAASPQVVAAESALNKFLELHIQIIALSRRNSDVRSLALSLGELRILHGQCENDLHALAEALEKGGLERRRSPDGYIALILFLWGAS